MVVKYFPPHSLLHGEDGVPAHDQDDCDDSDYSAIVSVRNYSHPAQLVFDVSSPVTISLFSHHYKLLTYTVHGEG